jgi:hypothetical protein
VIATDSGVNAKVRSVNGTGQIGEREGQSCDCDCRQVHSDRQRRESNGPHRERKGAQIE